jgi:hypothetical protein
MPSLRKIEVPKPLKMVVNKEEQEFGLFELIEHFVRTQSAYNDDGAGIKSALVLLDRIEKARKEAEELKKSLSMKEDGEEAAQELTPKPMILDEEDYQRLLKTIQKPHKLRNQMTGEMVSGYPITPAHIFGDYIKAVEEAEKI